jgi:hypothetical protein
MWSCTKVAMLSMEDLILEVMQLEDPSVLGPLVNEMVTLVTLLDDLFHPLTLVEYQSCARV